MQATAGYCLKVWPHFAPPDPITAITVFDVALSDSHFNAVKQWSAVVWEGWYVVSRGDSAIRHSASAGCSIEIAPRGSWLNEVLSYIAKMDATCPATAPPVFTGHSFFFF